ncbi:unnamed protein product, partial [Mesorhabditis belari]|uniref:Flavoprotein domain-containing protein n=1 Tax=Mesorhabditis belari TaxID=2138241 RepID=A0AAF3EW48_9BILA
MSSRLNVEGDGSPSTSPKRLRIADGNESDGDSVANSIVMEQQGNRPPFTRAHKIVRDPERFHLLIGVTGSVATIKLAELIKKLHETSPPGKLFIKVVATQCGLRMVETIEEEMADIEEIIYDDRDEWSMWRERGDPVLHIELRKWADALLIAPLDANTLAKIANGLCDNLLTSIVRAWDSEKPLYFAPAMNTMMWANPITHQHRKVLQEFFQYKEIQPISKMLMCGDTGAGGMATVQMIATVMSQMVRNRFAVYSPVV